MCVGAALGMMQLKISLPIMLSQFKFTMVPHSEVNARVMSTMLFPCSTVRAQLSRHDGQFEAAPVSGSIHSMVTLPGKAKSKIRAA
jgi:hypothetical protein